MCVRSSAPCAALNTRWLPFEYGAVQLRQTAGVVETDEVLG